MHLIYGPRGREYGRDIILRKGMLADQTPGKFAALFCCIGCKIWKGPLTRNSFKDMNISPDRRLEGTCHAQHVNI